MSIEFNRQLINGLPRLRRFALALSGTPSDAEDLVHSAVEKALAARDTWREGGRLESWLFKIIQNLWIDQQRATRRPAAPIEEAEEVAGIDGRLVLAQRYEMRAATAAFQGLPAGQQQALALVVLEGLSYQETADILGVAVGTIMSRVARARATMVESLERNSDEGRRRETQRLHGSRASR